MSDNLKITENVYELLVEAKRERNAAEARVAELTEDRDDWLLIARQRLAQVREAEARVARLEEALREIHRDAHSHNPYWSQEIARRALAHEEEASV